MPINVEQMSLLAASLLDAEQHVVDYEEGLKRAKEKARFLREETIPSVMQELGLSKISLDTGHEISVKQDVYASIPAAHKVAAMSWLSDNGHGGLIKTTVTASFAKGEAELAADLASSLGEQGLDVALDQSVHASTLKAFLREQIASGCDVPLDIFGARPVWVAKVVHN